MPLAKVQNEPTVDAINLVVGVLLFLAPWIFGFSSDAARQNAWYMGALIALVSFMELAEFAEWAEWINVTIGAWLLASAWILGFYTRTTALWVHLIAGLVVVISSALELWVVNCTEPRRD